MFVDQVWFINTCQIAVHVLMAVGCPSHVQFNYVSIHNKMLICPICVFLSVTVQYTMVLVYTTVTLQDRETLGQSECLSLRVFVFKYYKQILRTIIVVACFARVRIVHRCF